jgi:hypothetical protein
MAYKIMATAVASRFAVLSMDDDEDSPKRTQKKKVENKKTGIGMPSQKTDSNQKKKNKKSDFGKVSEIKCVHEQNMQAFSTFSILLNTSNL